MLKKVKILTLTLVLLLTIGQANAMPNSFADLVEKHSPSVVNISSTIKVKKIKENKLNEEQRLPFGKNSPLNKLFKDFIDALPQNGERIARPKKALGSGLIISADGYVITNHHVINGADDIVVKLNDDKTEYDAKLIGSDSKTDIALLKIKSKDDLPFSPLANSDKIRVGDWSVAIGNPFGLSGTVTAGIISALGRNIHQGPYDDFIQTDAAINPGNSGGPLFNVKGEVIGINTAIISRSGGSQGVGFSIPSNTVKLILAQLKSDGHVTRGWLGVRIQTITSNLAEALNLQEDTGALVAEVIKDSPAQKAGLKNGDVIIKFDGKKIDKMSTLPKVVAETKVNKTVKVEVIRNGKSITKKVKVALLEDSSNDTSQNSNKISKDEIKIYGMTLIDITDKFRKKYRLDDSVSGVIILATEVDSIVAEVGMRRGDIIKEIDGKKISSASQAKKLLEKAKDKSLLILVKRDDSSMFFALKVNDKENK